MVKKAVGPASNTKSIELTVGVVGIVVGVVGIYVTVLTFPAALDALGAVLSGSGLPTTFKGLAGGLTLLVVILTGLIALAALFIGLVCLSELVFYFLEVPHARIFGTVTSFAFFWLSTLVTILMYDFGAAGVFAGCSVALFVLLGMVISDAQG